MGDPFETNLIELKEAEEFIDDPLIDEPVTGAGNDDLWLDSDCEGSSSGNCQGEEDTTAQLEPAE